MKWLNNFILLPLFIKIPTYLALVLALGFGAILLIIDFNTSYQNQLQNHICYINQSGKISDNNEQFSFISHFYFDESGYFKISGMSANKREWVSATVYKDQNANLKLKEIKRSENVLHFLAENHFEILDTHKNRSIIKVKETGRTFLAESHDRRGQIHYSNLGLCGESWPGKVEFRIANEQYLIAWDQMGRVGFFPLAQMRENIPREIPQSPEFLFLAQDPNHLIRLSCSEMKTAPSSFIHFNNGVLSYSTSSYQHIVQYQVHASLLEFEAPVKPIVRKGQDQFFVLESNLLLEKMDSSWSLLDNWKMNHQAIIGQPWRSQAVVDEVPMQWLLSQSHKFWSSTYYLNLWNSYWIKYKLPELFNKQILRPQFIHWLVLPGQEHLMLSSLPNAETAANDYLQLRCPKIKKDNEVQ
jgi:hypothetical protein